MVLEKVIDIIAEELSVDPSEITEDSNLVEDLDADSLAVVDLVMSIEDAFDVEIPDTEVENLKTVGEIVQHIDIILELPAVGDVILVLQKESGSDLLQHRPAFVHVWFGECYDTYFGIS